MSESSGASGLKKCAPPHFAGTCENSTTITVKVPESSVPIDDIEVRYTSAADPPTSGPKATTYWGGGKVEVESVKERLPLHAHKALEPFSEHELRLSGLEPATTYTVRVRAKGSNGRCGQFSAAASFKTADAPPTDWLAELPPELHLCILEGVDDFSDCAAFSLASPRLGLLALRSGLARFKDPLFAVAMRLLLIERWLAGPFVEAPIMDTLNEATLRAYAADRRASADHFPWLARVSPALCLSSEVTGAGASRAEYWRLRRGDENGANLRRRLLQSGTVQHYEGERGAERVVRVELANGNVQHYEGEKGAVRLVRLELADGKVQHYEGEQGAERVVRMELANGKVQHYDGERGAERKVRMETANGSMQHYEGEKGAERVVRAEYANGEVQHYEGERGAERKVRAEYANGNVQYYEGEKGAERRVRAEFPDGKVQHYEGEQGAERVVRREFADGTMEHYEGEQDAERKVRAELPNGSVEYYEGERGAERMVRVDAAPL